MQSSSLAEGEAGVEVGQSEAMALISCSYAVRARYPPTPSSSSFHTGVAYELCE